MESKVAAAGRGEELLKLGCFTVNDFMKKAPAGWSRTKCSNILEKSGLKYEVARDRREYNGRQVRFYFPPEK